MLFVLAPKPHTSAHCAPSPLSCSGSKTEPRLYFRSRKSHGKKDDADGRKAHPEIRKQRSISECYFVVKGAALILPHDECMHVYRKINSHGASDIQEHLKSMFYLLREDDTLKMAVKLESVHAGRTRYLVVVSCKGRQDTEESCLLGVDCNNKTSIGLVLPVWADTRITLDGDGGFSVNSNCRTHIFKPVSVQAMWSALQTLHKASGKAREYNYFMGRGTHQWLEYYERCISSDRSCLNEWHAMDDLVSRRPPSPDTIRVKPTEKEATEKLIRSKLKELMMSLDLDDVTSKYIRTRLEEQLDMNLNDYKSFIDQEMLIILGQMDAPTEIFEYLYLGSEWNASNLDELKVNGVGHILNVTREIDNFFPGSFNYLNVRVYDDETTEMLKHWDQTYKYICKVKDEGSKVLVHCKMGISRSASVVIAYVMKAYDWNLDKALDFVKHKRNCIKPNTGFIKQLEIYQGILDASKQRHNSLWRSKSETNLKSMGSKPKRTKKKDRKGDNGKRGSLFVPGQPWNRLRPKSWSPQDHVAEQLFPSPDQTPISQDTPLVLKPLRCRQRFGTDPTNLRTGESTKPFTAAEETPLPATDNVSKGSNVKSRITELQLQANSVLETSSFTKMETKAKEAANKASGVVINLANQFESVSKPNTPSPIDSVMTETCQQSKGVPDMQGVEPVVSQTKPPAPKHHAILVKPTPWANETTEDIVNKTAAQVDSAKIENENLLVNNHTLSTVFSNSNELLENKGNCTEMNEKHIPSCVVKIADNGIPIKKPSHTVRELFGRQNSGNSILSSPNSCESCAWSIQSSCSSSPSATQRLSESSDLQEKFLYPQWTDNLQIQGSMSVEDVCNEQSREVSDQMAVDFQSIQCKLLAYRDIQTNDVSKELNNKSDFSYEKEDIPWTPGTVRKTKEQLEEQNLKRTISFDSGFPSTYKARSTPSTPPEDSTECSLAKSVQRSRSLRCEHRPRSMAHQAKWFQLSHVTPRPYRGHSPNYTIPHSISTPSVVEAVNEVICGTQEVLHSAIESQPSHFKFTNPAAPVFAVPVITQPENAEPLPCSQEPKDNNPLPGTVRLQREVIESLLPKNTQLQVVIPAKEPESDDKVKNAQKMRIIKEFGECLVPDAVADAKDEPFGVVKRITKEIEARGSTTPSKDRIVIVGREEVRQEVKAKRMTPPSSSTPASPTPNTRVETHNGKDATECPFEPQVLRKSRTYSDACCERSDDCAATPPPVPQRKASLDMERLRKAANPGLSSPHATGPKTCTVNDARKHVQQKLAKLCIPNGNEETKTSPATDDPSGKDIPPPAPTNCIAIVRRPPPGHKSSHINIFMPPTSQSRKMQQGQSHPLSKLTAKQRHANPLYNTM